MAKTLIVKGANYAENAFDTVSFGGSVPCTGISLDESAKSITALSPFTLTATPTPSNTTDLVSWASSDDTVATVANGVVTPLKLGTATITATCGSYSASCAVTIDNVVADFIAVTGYAPFRRTSTGNALTTDKQSGDTSYFAILAADRATGLYPIESKTDIDTSPYRFVPIMIPAGATKIIVNTTIGKFKTRTEFCDSTKPETQFNNGGAYCVSGSNSAYDQGSTAFGPLTISIPSNVTGLDSFCMAVAFGTTQSNFTDITSAFSIAFSYGE